MTDALQQFSNSISYQAWRTMLEAVMEDMYPNSLKTEEEAPIVRIKSCRVEHTQLHSLAVDGSTSARC